MPFQNVTRCPPRLPSKLQNGILNRLKINRLSASIKAQNPDHWSLHFLFEGKFICMFSVVEKNNEFLGSVRKTHHLVNVIG